MSNLSAINKAAAALKYDPNKGAAPRVIAKGKGKRAEKILALAEQGFVPIVQDRDLLQILMQLEENQVVPEIVFQSVAEIYAFVMNLEKQASNTHDDQPESE